MKLTANITLDELTKSQVAERKGINNNEKTREQKIAERVAYMQQLEKNSESVN